MNSRASTKMSDFKSQRSKSYQKATQAKKSMERLGISVTGVTDQSDGKLVKNKDLTLVQQLTSSTPKRKAIVLPQHLELMPKFLNNKSLELPGDEDLTKFVKEIAGNLIGRFPFFQNIFKADTYDIK